MGSCQSSEEEVKAVSTTKLSLRIPNNISRLGISLSLLEEFKTVHSRRLLWKTTAEVCEEVVRPLTLSSKESMCDQLINERSFGVDVANVFVVHSWGNRFIDTVDAILYHFSGYERPESLFLWMDIFSVNQHAEPLVHVPDWSFKLQRLISLCQHTVLVMLPSLGPSPLVRAWCLLELFHTAETGSQFEVVMPSSEREAFLASIHSQEAFKTVLSDIDVADSSASRVADRDAILREVVMSVGYEIVNRAVLELMRDWVIRTLETAVNTEPMEERCIELKLVLASMFRDHGELEQAEPLLLTSYKRRRSKLGEGHPLTLQAMRLLADLYRLQGRTTDAENLLHDCVMISTQRSGEEHEDTLDSMNELAMHYLSTGNFEEAESLLRHCLKTQQVSLGGDSPVYITYMGNLATVLEAKGDISGAETLRLDCLEMSRLNSGKDHPLSLSCMHSLAKLYHSQGRFEEAENLLTECLRLRRVKVGPDQSDTLETMRALANVYTSRKKFDKAGPLLKEYLQLCRIKFGEEHSETMVAIHNLGGLFATQGRFDKAEPLLVNYLELCVRHYGEESIEAVEAMSNAALAFASQGKHEMAEPLYTGCLALYSKIMGRKHPNTLLAMSNLAGVYLYLAKYAEAESLLKEALSLNKEVYGEEHTYTLECSSNLLKIDDLKAGKLPRSNSLRSENNIRVIPSTTAPSAGKSK